MGALLGSAIIIDDPLFGLSSDDGTIANQMARIALNTPPGFHDAFPDYGFEMRNEILSAKTPTAIAMLPLEVRAALEAEPAFVGADVVATTIQGGGTTVLESLNCSIELAEDNSVGLTLPVT